MQWHLAWQHLALVLTRQFLIPGHQGNRQSVIHLPRQEFRLNRPCRDSQRAGDRSSPDRPFLALPIGAVCIP